MHSFVDTAPIDRQHVILINKFENFQFHFLKAVKLGLTLVLEWQLLPLQKTTFQVATSKSDKARLTQYTTKIARHYTSARKT